MKFRNKELEKFKESVNDDIKRREAEQAKWDDLKKASVNALRANGYRAPNLDQREHGFGGEVRTQEEDIQVIDSETAPYKSFTDWQEDQEEGASSGYVDPDSLSTKAAYFQSEETAPHVISKPHAEVSADLFASLGKILSKKQLELYNLHIERGLGIVESAAILGMKHQNASTMWKLIEAKLRNAFAEKTKEGHQ